MSVGWLWNAYTAVVPRRVAKAIEEFEEQANRNGVQALGCVIQGTKLGIARVIHPEGCSGVSILILKNAAEITLAARDQWHRVNSADVEKLRVRNSTFTYYSYQTFPRPQFVKGNHGFPLCEYDAEFCRQRHVIAQLIVQGQQHLLNLSDPAINLERGGLLTDDQGRIVGMVLRDASIVWTKSLEQALQYLPEVN